MPLPPKLLNDGETPVIDLNPHWFHFATPVAALLASIALGVFSLTVDGGFGTFLKWLSLGLIVVIFGAAYLYARRQERHAPTATDTEAEQLLSDVDDDMHGRARR